MSSPVTGAQVAGEPAAGGVLPEESAPQDEFRRSGIRMVGRRTAYVLTGLPFTILALLATLPLVAVGLVSYPFFVGQPILAAGLGLSRAVATVERRRLGGIGIRAPEAYHRRVTTRWFRRFREIAGDGQRWRDLAHQLLTLIARVLTFAVTVAWWAVVLAGVTYALWGWALPTYPDRTDLLDLMGWHDDALRIPVYLGVGLLFAALLPIVLRATAGLDAALARGLLSDDNAALRERIDRLAATRSAAIAAEAATLRRVERDIHDGPQQRLVRLTMDLQAAQRRLTEDPAAAAPLLESAVTLTHEALAELRALSRGIAPPVLADRGLAAALAAAAGRCPVPTTLDVALPDGRLPAAVENAAYFVVTEALTNVAKHADATAALVQAAVTRDPRPVLRVAVRDDGVGGAHPGKGHGLAGLADRLAAVDGMIGVDSPPGGPTVVTATIPLDATELADGARWAGATLEAGDASRVGGGLAAATGRARTAARRGWLRRRGGGG